MNEDKMHLINKIFNNATIRTVWDKEEEKYYISIVDIVTVITESKDGRKYWNKLKQRLSKEGNETVTNCHQLKLKAQDGKYRMTDVCDIEGMFRIIESIPSKNADEERQKNELKKQQQYNTDVFANKAKESIKTELKEPVELIQYKENIFKRILNKIKLFFTKHN